MVMDYKKITSDQAEAAFEAAKDFESGVVDVSAFKKSKLTPEQLDLLSDAFETQKKEAGKNSFDPNPLLMTKFEYMTAINRNSKRRIFDHAAIRSERDSCDERLHHDIERVFEKMKEVEPPQSRVFLSASFYDGLKYAERYLKSRNTSFETERNLALSLVEIAFSDSIPGTDAYADEAIDIVGRLIAKNGQRMVDAVLPAMLGHAASVYADLSLDRSTLFMATRNGPRIDPSGESPEATNFFNWAWPDKVNELIEQGNIAGLAPNNAIDFDKYDHYYSRTCRLGDLLIDLFHAGYQGTTEMVLKSGILDSMFQYATSPSPVNSFSTSAAYYTFDAYGAIVSSNPEAFKKYVFEIDPELGQSPFEFSKQIVDAGNEGHPFFKLMHYKRDFYYWGGAVDISRHFQEA